MDVLKSKFSIFLLINYTFMVLLISRFNTRFLMFEYGYEPLFLLNLIFLFLSIFIKAIIDKRIAITPFELLVYLLTIWLIISLFINVSDSHLNGINIGRILNIIIPMFFVSVIYLWKDKITKKQIINILGYMVAVAGLIGLSALLTIIFPELMISTFNWDRVDIDRGTISPINNGTFLSLFIIPSISLFIYHEKSNVRYVFLICFILILLGLISTGRRGSYFPAIVCIVLFFIIVLYKNFTVSGLKKYLKYFAIIASLFIIFTLYLIDSGDVGRLFGKVETNADNIGRLTRMGPALNFINEKPLTGDGIGNYYYRLKIGEVSKLNSIDYNSWVQLSDPHNTYIMILAEAGFIGLFIFLTIIFYILKRLKPRDVISLGIVLGVSIFLINCMVDTRLWKGLVRIDTVFWIFVGIGIIYNEKIKLQSNKS